MPGWAESHRTGLHRRPDSGVESQGSCSHPVEFRDRFGGSSKPNTPQKQLGASSRICCRLWPRRRIKTKTSTRFYKPPYLLLSLRLSPVTCF